MIATVTATSNIEPAATLASLPSSTPETTLSVIRDYIKMRVGPAINFAAVSQLMSGDQLALLGRMIDNSWLYVRSSDGQEGWVRLAWVDLSGIIIEDYAIETPSPSLETTVKVMENRVNLRSGPGTYYLKLQSVTYGDQLSLLGRTSDNSWLYVKTSDGQEGWIKATYVDLNAVNFYSDFHPIKTSPPTETATPVVLDGIEGHWIDVDLSEQTLYAYDGTVLVASFLVSTGIDAFPTVTGKYHIYAKFRYSDMHGSDYYLPNVPWSMYYEDDFSIHGTYWHHNFGIPMSHGCINMDISDAEWLYDWAPVGTLVNIHS
jgi:lipoprotein-anchoring transpeptidase ErfK/SrfK